MSNKVKLTSATVEILKNLAGINQTLLFQKGSVVSTRNVKKTLYAEATLVEKFPQQFTIYDLSQFLLVMDQFETPVLDFGESDKYVVLCDEAGGMSVKYHYGDDSLGYLPDPKRKWNMPDPDVELVLTEVQLKKITTMARTLGTPELALQSDGKSMKFVTVDSNNSSTNTMEEPLGEAPTEDEFNFVWRLDYLKMLSGTYDLAISREGLSRFKHKDIDITYHVMLEANASSYTAA